MILKIYGSKNSRVINIHREFFDTVKVKANRGLVTIGPKEKAEQLGNDLYGRDLRGIILERDGKTILNTLDREPMESKKLEPVRQGLRFKSKDLKT